MSDFTNRRFDRKAFKNLIGHLPDRADLHALGRLRRQFWITTSLHETLRSRTVKRIASERLGTSIVSQTARQRLAHPTEQLRQCRSAESLRVRTTNQQALNWLIAQPVVGLHPRVVTIAKGFIPSGYAEAQVENIRDGFCLNERQANFCRHRLDVAQRASRRSQFYLADNIIQGGRYGVIFFVKILRAVFGVDGASQLTRGEIKKRARDFRIKKIQFSAATFLGSDLERIDRIGVIFEIRAAKDVKGCRIGARQSGFHPALA